MRARGVDGDADRRDRVEVADAAVITIPAA
jgi:hypothetical protein